MCYQTVKLIPSDLSGELHGVPQDKEVQHTPWIIRNIGHHQGCGCICKHCHPEGSDYPYQEAVADQNEAKRLSTLKLWRGLTAVYIRPTKCDRPCAEHSPSEPRPTDPEPGRVALPRDPILAVRQDRHTEVRDENPSVPLPEMPYNSMAASLRRISLLETRSQRIA